MPNVTIGIILTLVISQFVFAYKVNEMYPSFVGEPTYIVIEYNILKNIG